MRLATFKTFGLLFTTLLIFAISPVYAQEEVDPEVIFDEGVVAYSEGLYTEALGQFDAVLKIEPGNAEAHQYKGMCLVNTDKLDEGLGELGEAHKIDPDLEGLHVAFGSAYIKAKRLDDAVQILQEGLSKFPDDLEIKFALGYAYFLKEDYKSALPLLDAAKADPDVAQRAYLYAGLSAINIGKRSKARVDLVEAVRINPNSEEGKIAKHYFDALEEAPENARNWSISLTALYQYDSNVVAASDQIDFPITIRDKDISQKDDHRGLVMLAGSYKPIDNEHWSFGFGYNFYESFHSEIREFNLMYHNPRVYLARWFNISGKRSSVFVRYNYSTALLGEEIETYSQTHTAKPGFAVQWFNSFVTEAAYIFVSKDFYFEGDDIRDNTAHGGGLTNAYSFLKGKGFIKLNLIFMNEDAQDDTYDINRGIAEVSLGLPLPLEMKMQLTGAYEMEDHFNDDVLDRKDNIFRSNLILTRTIAGPVSFVASFSYRNNDSNVDALTYERFVGGSGFTLKY